MNSELIRYRLQQAEESLSEAELLFSAGKYRGAINRGYYALFYSVLALLLEAGKSSSKHSGVISLFDEHFVKNGIFSKEMSRALHQAFELRLLSDYRELVKFDRKEVQELIKSAKDFTGKVREYFEGRGIKLKRTRT